MWLGLPPPRAPAPTSEEKPRKLITMTVQLAATHAGRELGENYIFVDYPEGLGIKRRRENTVDFQVLEKTVNLCSAIDQPALLNATKLAGLGRVRHHLHTEFALSWNKHFGDDYDFLQKSINQPWQKWNHLPASQLLSRKDFLGRELGRLMKLFPTEYNIAPQTFVLPLDRDLLIAAMEADPNSLWIEKPYDQSRGKGITVWSAQNVEAFVKKVSQPKQELHPDLQNTPIKLKPPRDPAAVVVQRYLEKPFLIDGLKFDLRLYVLVTSFDPLCCYIFSEGLGRFCTSKYTSDRRTISNNFVHLTNSSLNKYSDNYKTNQDTEEMSTGSKRSYSSVLEQLEKRGVDIGKLRARINDVIIKSLLSISSQSNRGHRISQMRRKQGFELYGVDIILDHEANPFILEFNITPDISTTIPMDKFIKGRLVADTLHLSGIPLPPGAVKAAEAAGMPPSTPDQSHQTITTDDNKNGKSTQVSDEIDIQNFVVELEERSHRTGLFEIMFPISSAQVRHYAKFDAVEKSEEECKYENSADLVQQKEVLENGDISEITAAASVRARYEILATLLEKSEEAKVCM